MQKGSQGQQGPKVTVRGTGRAVSEGVGVSMKGGVRRRN